MKFTKLGAIRFLSHLDLLKCIERALRRSAIHVAYTEGFHPRIRISAGPALALGHASRCEWLDVDLAANIAVDELRERLNAALPHGLRVIAARQLEEGTKALQVEVRRATYLVKLNFKLWNTDTLREQVQALLARQEIPFRKNNKMLNLRTFIDDLRVGTSATSPLELTLNLGPAGSVRPEDVLGSLAPQGEVTAAFIERTGLFVSRDGQWMEP